MSYNIRKIYNENSQGKNGNDVGIAMKKLRDAINKNQNITSSDCLFKIPQEGMAKETFFENMRTATNSSDGSLDNEIGILYSIINTDNEEGISSDEFTASIDNFDKEGEVSPYELWSNLGDFNDLITEETEETEKPEETQETAPDENNEDIKEYMNRDNWQGYTDRINSMVDKFGGTPNEVVSTLVATGFISEKEAEFYRQAFVYSQLTDDEKKVLDKQLDSIINDKGYYTPDEFNNIIQEQLECSFGENDLYEIGHG